VEVVQRGGPSIRTYPSLRPPTLIRMTGRRLCVAVALVAALSACGAVENKAKSVASSAVNKGVSTAAEGIVGSAFTETLSKAGITLDGDPDCSSNLTTDVKGLTVKGSVDCTGKTTKGDSATARFNGVIAVGSDSTSCKGHFVVKVQGKARLNKDIDVCEAAKRS
jgi:hypothetical protein